MNRPLIFFSCFANASKSDLAINAMLKHIGGKRVADGNISATAKVQKQIIKDYLDGTRKGSKKDWEPRYMRFPMAGYTKRGGIGAIDKWKAIKKNFAA